MPDREKVLQWYKSLQETLAAENIDVTRPGDLMRIKTLCYQEDPDFPGQVEEGGGKIQYAFVKRNIDPQTGLRSEYEIPMPEISRGKQKNDYLKQYETKIKASSEASEAFSELEKARKEGKSYEQISKLKQSYQLYEEDAKSAEKRYRKFCDDLWKEQDQWLLTNNRFFNPETDYEQIEELYNQAGKGLLFLNDLSGNTKGRKQILIREDGKSAVGPSFLDMDDNKLQHGELYNAKGDKRRAFEQKYGEYPSLRYVPQRPEALRPAKKPGAFSWFKRIISFGLAKGDFVRYEQEMRNYERRQEEIREYDANLPQLKEEIRQHNLAAFQRYDEIVSLEHKDEYPNVTNPGRMAMMQLLIDRTELKPLDDDGRNNVWNEYHEMARRNHMLELPIEYKENPASFNDNGTRNAEESERYWKQKVTISSDYREIIEKQEAKLAKGEIRDRVLKEKDENRQNDVLGNLLSAEQADPHMVDFNPWIKQSETALSQKIGALFNVPKGISKAQFGRMIVMALCTQNQKCDVDGKERPENEVKTDAQCAKDLNRLVELANNPPQDPEEQQEIYQGFLADFEIRAVEETNLVRCCDSMASIVANVVENVDAETITSGVAHAASMLAKTVAQNKDFDFLSATVEIGGKDTSVSNSYEREIARKVGGRCLKLQDGYQKKMEAHKEGFAKSADDVVKAKPTKQLDVKRPLNLGM